MSNSTPSSSRELSRFQSPDLHMLLELQSSVLGLSTSTIKIFNSKNLDILRVVNVWNRKRGMFINYNVPIIGIKLVHDRPEKILLAPD